MGPRTLCTIRLLEHEVSANFRDEHEKDAG
jgi:hypothetical protein